VRKIDSDSQLPSELLPSIVNCPGNLSLPVSMLTGDSASSISTMLPTSNITTSLMSTLTAGDPRNKGGRSVGSITKVRALKTKQLKDIIEEASQQILNAQKKGKLKCNEVKTMLRDLEVKQELDKGFLDAHLATINTRVYYSKNASRLGNSQTSPLAELEPLLVDYCLKLSAIGQPSMKDQVMALVSLMINNHELEEKVIA
jgi:hypothetical protein